MVTVQGPDNTPSQPPLPPEIQEIASQHQIMVAVEEQTLDEGDIARHTFVSRNYGSGVLVLEKIVDSETVFWYFTDQQYSCMATSNMTILSPVSYNRFSMEEIESYLDETETVRDKGNHPDLKYLANIMLQIGEHI